ncbi:MAG: metal-dependent hydrolase [Gammaproteobacteria bacterium]|nr:metal-dependent hydrolase [Gammaproteobacteria bacterium]MDJ0873404.1 metal-dependent hydrolase [Gammaproteobacteria bacterium]
MDIVTQGLIGAAMSQAAARRAEMKLATVVGFLAGLAADADVLIRSAADPLLQVEYHRHFTHSLFFVPIGALVVAGVLWPLLRRRLPFPRLYIYALLGYSLAGFLDLCTSYGTYWLWPLIDQRLALHVISIVDPAFTLILVLAVLFAWRRTSRGAARLGVALAGAYLLVGVFQHHRATQEATQLAASRGHVVERLVVKPTLGNLLLWRSVYAAGDRFFVDAVRVGLTGVRVYPGASAAAFRSDSIPQLAPVDSVQAVDIERFQRFSDGFVIRHPQIGNVLGDVRYAMSPVSALPLWGIELAPERPQAHARYVFFRNASEAERRQFIDMLLGRDTMWLCHPSVIHDCASAEPACSAYRAEQHGPLRCQPIPWAG